MFVGNLSSASKVVTFESAPFLNDLENQCAEILPSKTPSRVRALKQIDNLRNLPVNKLELCDKRIEARPSVCSVGSDSPEFLITPSPVHHGLREDDVFGKLLHNFGYKKVYLASARTICNRIPIWHLQRPTNLTRIDEIIKHKRETHAFPGVVSIFDYELLQGPSLEKPQKTGIFDGQHRVLAINQLLKETPNIDMEILIEVYPVESEEQIKSLFLELNKAEMVQEIDLPNRIAPQKKIIVDEACSSIRQQNPTMFGNERCRPPNIHEQTLRNDLFQSGVLEIGNIQDSESLVELIEKCNEILAELPDSEWSIQLQRNLPKAKRSSFFLGLTKSWIHDIMIKKILQNEPRIL